MSNYNSVKEEINGEIYTMEIYDGNSYLYGRNKRTLKDECIKLNTFDFRINGSAFFMGKNTYYISKSLKNKSAEEISKLAKYIAVCDATDGKSVALCIFLDDILVEIEKLGKQNFIIDGEDVYDINGYRRIKAGDGLLTVAKYREGYGVIDHSHNVIVPFGKYTWIDGFTNGFTRVKKGDKWGIIDIKGREVVSVKYDKIWNFYNKRNLTHTKIFCVDEEPDDDIDGEVYIFYFESRKLKLYSYFISGEYYCTDWEKETYPTFDGYGDIMDALDGCEEAWSNID